MKAWTAQTVLVTGASRGLGRTIALAFGAEGAFVGVGYYRSERGACETLDEIRAAGGDGALVRADVRDADQVAAAFQTFLSDHKCIDVLVNNAGIVDDKFFAMMSADSWSAVLETNLGGAFNCSRAAVRSMMARERGAIVNLGSVAGAFASPGQANYAASKGGILALTKTLAAELGPKGIRVNAVLPGLIDEGMVRRMDRRLADERRGHIPLGRFGRAEEVAAAVLFLASEKAAYITGQHLIVDGGLTV